MNTVSQFETRTPADRSLLRSSAPDDDRKSLIIALIAGLAIEAAVIAAVLHMPRTQPEPEPPRPVMEAEIVAAKPPPPPPCGGPLRLNGGRSWFSRRCMALKYSLPLQEYSGGIRGLGALGEPSKDLFFVDFHSGGLGERIVVADLLDEPPVSWGAGVRHHQAVERVLLCADSP